MACSLAVTIPDPLRPPFDRICKLGVAGSSPARSISENGLKKSRSRGVSPHPVLGAFNAKEGAQETFRTLKRGLLSAASCAATA